MIDKPLLRPLSRRSFLPASLALGGIGLQLANAQAVDAPASAPAGLTAAPTSMSGVSPRLTVHAIDSFHGVTGAGLKYDLSRYEGDKWVSIKSVLSMPGGRPADPLLLDAAYKAGRYEILLHLDDYFAMMNAKLPSPSFLSKVPLRFEIKDASQRVHVAALFSPWGYSYYRGS
ncbi:MAG: hydroxyisourate hydrolase [Burkholderiales bacterium]